MFYELVNTSLGLWLYLAVAGVGFVGWWSLADSRRSGDGEVAFFALFISLLWGLTLPLAIIVLIGVYGCHFIEDTSGWFPRWIKKRFGDRKK
jgi:hypothetical protein